MAALLDAVLVDSHDRFFTDKIANRRLVFNPDETGQIDVHMG
ncbi:ATPase subunit of ABC transporter with duplicated ATPase domains [Arthrobacter psychrochitiniphilus]|nr:ATPase subunit of ABC transporter with duplicated ATPase domains [Arthrobacter psychrochitiniphilus]